MNQEFEFSIKDKANPNSLVNITTSQVSTCINAIPDEYLTMSDEELEKEARVGETEHRLRVAWTMELERAIRTNKPINPSNVYMGTCTKKYFFAYIVGNSLKLAYVIRPFPEFQIELEDVMRLLNREVRKIATRPLEDENGKFDHKLAAIKVNLWKDAVDRKHGQAVQKIESKSQSLVITKDVTPTNDMAEIDKRLAQLEGREVLEITHEPKENL